MSRVRKPPKRKRGERLPAGRACEEILRYVLTAPAPPTTTEIKRYLRRPEINIGNPTTVLGHLDNLKASGLIADTIEKKGLSATWAIPQKMSVYREIWGNPIYRPLQEVLRAAPPVIEALAREYSEAFGDRERGGGLPVEKFKALRFHCLGVPNLCGWLPVEEFGGRKWGGWLPVEKFKKGLSISPTFFRWFIENQPGDLAKRLLEWYHQSNEGLYYQNIEGDDDEYFPPLLLSLRATKFTKDGRSAGGIVLRPVRFKTLIIKALFEDSLSGRLTPEGKTYLEAHWKEQELGLQLKKVVEVNDRLQELIFYLDDLVPLFRDKRIQKDIDTYRKDYYDFLQQECPDKDKNGRSLLSNMPVKDELDREGKKLEFHNKKLGVLFEKHPVLLGFEKSRFLRLVRGIE